MPATLSLADAVVRFLDHLRDERRASGLTVAAYGRDLRQLVAFAGETPSQPLQAVAAPLEESPGESPRVALERVDVPLLRAWLAWLASQGAIPATRARKLAAVKSLYKYLERRGLVRENPAAWLQSPRVHRPMPMFLNEQDAAAVVEAPVGNGAEAVRDRALLEVLYGSGLRVAELVGLDLDDLDLRKGEVRVVGKGDKERLVPFGPPAAKALRAWLKRRASFARGLLAPTAVFLNSRGQRLGVRRVQERVQRYGALGAGRPDLHPHALRHSCATHMLNGGANLRVIQEMLGHTSLSITQRYTHLSVQELQRVHARAHPLAGCERGELLRDPFFNGRMAKK